MSKHTPGPWQIEIVDLGKEGRDISVFSETQKTPYGNSRYIVFPNSALTEWDARLIAAAPELLQALKILNHHAKIDDVYRLIAKAEGEQK